MSDREKDKLRAMMFFFSFLNSVPMIHLLFRLSLSLSLVLIISICHHVTLAQCPIQVLAGNK